MQSRFLDFLYPPKCIICNCLLTHEQTDMCHECRQNIKEFTFSKKRIPFVARWSALWYYNDSVRYSLLRYKFYRQRSYAVCYGRLMAMKLSREQDSFDVLSWIPIAALRRHRRGYDQVKLIAQVVARELDIPLVPTLHKFRHTPPQSGLGGLAQRRANVMGAYRAINREQFAGKRVLLLDDIITTGATASECARTLLTANAKEVILMTVASAVEENKQKQG